MLDGSVPFSEGIPFRYRYCSFDRLPIVEGIDPDSEYM
jgi:hypothetical protein